MQISQQLNVAVVVALLNSLLSPFISIVPLKMVLGASVDYCYSDIGCFPLSDEFYHPKHRPFNVRPWHRQHINTQFELFNKDHPAGFMMEPWNRKNLLKSKFNPKLETKIIVPGWLDNINRALWVKRLKDALLYLWVPVNIVVVRWTNFTPYTIATANTRVVGAELANWMKFLDREFNYDPAYYHIIGHSLGAHIAGYCGDRVHGLGRITALDPARPFFQHMPKSVRLDRSDAKFIDAIHSDFTPENAIFLLMSYGMTTPVGHLDFYPNGPPLYQPGCIRDTLLSVQNGIARGLEHNSLSIAFLESIRYLTACDHQRSHEWFIESITNRECAFVGVRCNEFEGMINGRCTCDDSPSACAIMGIHADQMYLHNVHEELWPVRAGSIDYKYKKSPQSKPKPPKSAPHRPTLPPKVYSPLTTPGLDLANLGESMENNYHLLTQAALLSQGQQQQVSLNAADMGMASQAPNKDEIYAQLKHQAMQMHNQDEPQMAPLVYQDETMDLSTDSSNAVQTEPSVESAQATETPEEAEQMAAAAAEMEQTFDENMNALNDMAFAGYLRTQLLLSQLETLNGGQGGSDSASGERPQNSTLALADSDEMDDTDETGTDRRRSDRRSSQKHGTKGNGHPDQYGGHPVLVSSVNRDIESWYEDNGRWHLKTNNQPKYCSNQYQLLIFLGPLKSSRVRDRLRADLLVSIVGSKGQLLNQRFVPRGSTLTSFTMQPFFILLEGSYSLGQIKSVALSWEARRDPDPVQATITFQSSELQALGENIAIYKAKNFPWLPEETKYDKSAGFTHRSPRSSSPTAAAAPSSSSSSSTSSSSSSPVSSLSSSLLSALPKVISKGSSLSTSADPGSAAAAALYELRYKRPSMALKSIASGHYSQKYRRTSQRHALKRSSESATVSTARSDSEARRATGSSRNECSLSRRTGCQGAAVNRTARTLRRFDPEDPLNSLADESLSLPEEVLDTTPAEYAQELAELDRQMEELQKLRQENLQQHEEIRLDRQLQQQQQQEQQSSYIANSQMPNQTYLVKDMSQEQTQSDNRHLADDLNVDAADPYFVRLVDPIDETASYKPKPGSKIRPIHDDIREGEITIDLHNADLKHNSDEDSIVVNQVIVSPLQANYGRYGRNAKTFCPPMTKQKLTRDKTLRLTLSMMSKCSDHHHYEQQMQQLRLLQEHEQQLMQPLEAY